MAILKIMEVDIHEAQTHLSKLMARIVAGDRVVIKKAGKPCAELVPVNVRGRRRTVGPARAELAVPDALHDPLPKELEDLFG